MPRGVDDVYAKPAGTTFVDNTVAEADDMNTLIDDMISDLNTARPIAVGGTGATTATAARTALGVPTGTSGAVLGFLNAENTFSENQTISGASPRFAFEETDEGDQTWSVGAAAGIFTIRDDTAGDNLFSVDTSGNVVADGNIGVAAGDASTPGYNFATDPNTGFYSLAADSLGISAGGSYRGRVDANGIYSASASEGNPGEGNTTVGCGLRTAGRVMASATSTHCGSFNRNGDGDVMYIRESGNVEGTVSVSGATVTWGSFCGAHWSQLKDQNKIEIPRGTIVDSINERCSWGSERNDQLAKFKPSDKAGSRAVLGVFMRWDDDRILDDDGNDIYEGIHDAYIASLGAWLIRIAPGVAVEVGDLIESNGDGCGRVQDDDIFRSSTVAKITCTDVIEVHEDGSFTVPCTLHCG